MQRNTKTDRRIRADMHMHTTASDGTWSVELLLKKLVEAGIEVFSVTDHDTVENIPELIEKTNRINIKYIPGVEVNSALEGFSYHILGYGIDYQNKELNSLLQFNIKCLEDFDSECISLLESKHGHVKASDFHAYEDNRERGGWKALNFLKDMGMCKDHREFFKLFVDDSYIFSKLCFKHPKEAIDTIVKAGGVPVLAHPGAAFYSRDYGSVLNNMLEYGIRGIECYHPENSSEITDYCLKLCKEKDLLITGGSDCHGDFLPARKLCLPELYLDMLDLKELL
ncbi:MAG: PHP domain-containing protein [Bacillota bacterium]